METIKKKNTFGLLVKHAIKNTWKWLLLANGLILGMVTLFSLFVKIIPDGFLNNFFGQTLIVAFAALIFAAYAAVITLLIYTVVQNCYKSIFSDEGYLKFTMPININHLIFSRILVNFIYAIFTIICVFFSVIIAELFFGANFFTLIYSFISSLLSEPLLLVSGFIQVAMYIVIYSYVILLALALANSTFRQKRKIGMAILFYFLITTVLSVLQSISSLLSFGFGYDQNGAIVFSFGVIGKVYGVYIINFTRFIFNAGIIVGLHFLTNLFMTKKLEL